MSDTDEKTAKMILAMIIAIPIPIISVFLLKSTTEYLGSDKEELSEKVIENNTEKPIMESVKEDPIEDLIEEIVPEPEYTPTAEEIKEAENATEEDVPDWYRKLHPARV
jgi:ABC-type cobalt transport system substrate-binding protein